MTFPPPNELNPRQGIQIGYVKPQWQRGRLGTRPVPRTQDRPSGPAGRAGVRRRPPRLEFVVKTSFTWKRRARALGGLLLATAALHAGLPQYDRNSSPRSEGWYPGVDSARTAREMLPEGMPAPKWTNPPEFASDVFTFARVRYTHRASSRRSSVWWAGGYWYSDTPDSDLNLSYRLQQMTSLRVDPNGRVVDITDPDLFNYPWIYMVEPGLLVLEEEEVPILRKYLLNGGFMMADDFWGTPQWDNFEHEMKRVFPDRSWTELDLSHPIFHAVIDLPGPKEKLQIPNVVTGRGAGVTGVTWENKRTRDGEWEECKDVHFRALLDDKGRIMVLGCHNTDNGDGWEREGEDEYFFHRFSENIAYPLAINIVFYSMTH